MKHEIPTWRSQNQKLNPISTQFQKDEAKQIQRILFRPTGTQVILPNPPTVETVGYFLSPSGLILLLIPMAL